MRGYARNVTLFAISHFFVDFACAYAVFSGYLGDGRWVTLLLIYNFCAFAAQMPLGIVADKFQKNRFVAIAGLLIVALSLFISGIPYLFAAVIGLGNALFHVGAGRDVLCASRGKFSALGIFVSPGAVGLFCGTLLGKADSAFPANMLSCVIAAVLLLLAAVIFLKLKDFHLRIQADPSREKVPYIFFAALCLFTVVCLRSYVGMALSFPWKTTVWWSLGAVLALASGKALGGLLADRFGATRTSLVSLGLSAVLAVFWENHACGIASVLLFNMTMPISLGAIVRHMPARPGFGFGLLTFALFIGILPAMLGSQAGDWFMPLGFACAAVVSAVLLWVGLRGERHG
ncbi:MAG: hypothetical protein EOM14_03245 [Clostridia bacterium]|nr:hypothetical protein [Clostridia bacterium]